MAESERQIPRLQTLLDAVRLLNSTLELKELTAIILEVVRAEIAVERVSMFLVERERKVLRPLVTQEVDDREISFPIGIGIAGTVAATGDILDIADAYADPRFNSHFDRTSGFYTNDLFALPVCNRTGEVVGVMELLNRLRPITSADREFLLGISVYIGLALENAYLHSRFSPKAEVELPVQQGTNDSLRFAMGVLELIPDQGDLPSPVWAHVENMRRSMAETAEAALKLEEFLDQQRDACSRIDLNAELHSLSALQSEAWVTHNIEATLIAEKTPPVSAYAYELRLVLAYLIRRAEAAILQRNSDRQIRMHLWGAGNTVCFSILYGKSADEFSDSNGLALASRILARCGGRIRFESNVSTGTMIFVELPAAQESIAEG